MTVPLARPGLAAAGVLVFAFVLGDLSTPQVLAPPGLTTLGTQFNADSATDVDPDEGIAVRFGQHRGPSPPAVVVDRLEAEIWLERAKRADNP